MGQLRHPLDAHLPAGRVEQRQQLGRAVADVLVRLAGREPGGLPAAARIRHRLERPGLVLGPHRQPPLRPQPVGVLDQLFFGAASGSVTTTGPLLRLRRTTPVGHQLRACCQCRPAPRSTHQMVYVAHPRQPVGGRRERPPQGAERPGRGAILVRGRARGAPRRGCAPAPPPHRPTAAPPPCPGAIAASPSVLKRATSRATASPERRPTPRAAVV